MGSSRGSGLASRGAGLAVRGALLVMALAISPSARAATCESLSSLALPNTAITIAQAVPAGSFTTPFNATLINLPAFCRVAATLKPSGDSDIKIEVWLPSFAEGSGGQARPSSDGGAKWNGKLLAVGNGGWAGSIPYPALAAALRRGYAGSATDTGHEGAGGNFALGHPEKLVDYAYRSEHEMTVTAKAIVNAFYGNAPAQSVLERLFNGRTPGARRSHPVSR